MIKLTESSHFEDNEKADAALSKLRQVREVDILYISPSKFAEKYLNYPYIETPEGLQHFGLNSINQYVEQELAKSNGNGGNGNGKK